MRLIYFHEVRKDFRIDKEYVEFLGPLFLHRKPGIVYSPIEVATKKDVDDTFNNLTMENIADGLVPIATFPAFMGDIRNKKGSNVFTLLDVISKGRYVMPKIDYAGRVISGAKVIEGGLTNAKIPYKVLDFSTYESLGHPSNKGRSYHDFSTGSDSRYLAVYEENNVLNSVRIDKNLTQPSAVINELGVDTALNMWVDAKLSSVKGDGYANLVRDNPWGDGTGDVDPIEPATFEVRAGGGRPWHLQYDFSKDGSGLSTTVSKPLVILRDKPINKASALFVDRNKLKIMNNGADLSREYGLNSNGTLKTAEFDTGSTMIMPTLPANRDMRAPFVIRGRTLYTVTGGSGKLKVVMSSGVGDNWTSAWVNGPDLPYSDVRTVTMLVMGERIYFFSLAQKTVCYIEIGMDPTNVKLVTMASSFNIPATSLLHYGITSFVKDDFIYIVPGYQKHFVDKNVGYVEDAKRTEFFKIEVKVTDLVGSWKKLTSKTNFVDAERDVFTYKGKVYLISGRMDRTLGKVIDVNVENLLEDNVTNLILASASGIRVDKAFMPPALEEGAYEEDTRNRAGYWKPNPNFKQGYWKHGNPIPPVIRNKNPNYKPGYWAKDPRGDQYPDIWVPPVGEEYIEKPNPAYVEGWWKDNPDYKPAYEREDPHAKINDMSNIYFDIDTLKEINGTLIVDAFKLTGSGQDIGAKSYTSLKAAKNSYGMSHTYGKGTVSNTTGLEKTKFAKVFPTTRNVSMGIMANGGVNYIVVVDRSANNKLLFCARYSKNTANIPVWSDSSAGAPKKLMDVTAYWATTIQTNVVLGKGARKKVYETVPARGEPRVWVPNEGYEVSWVPSVGEPYTWVAPVKHPDKWVPPTAGGFWREDSRNAEGYWKDNPDYKPAHEKPNPNYKPGHYSPDPRNKPAHWKPNPNYVPPTTKPNPNYKPGYYSPDPRNKPGYWEVTGGDGKGNAVIAGGSANSLVEYPGHILREDGRTFVAGYSVHKQTVRLTSGTYQGHDVHNASTEPIRTIEKRVANGIIPSSNNVPRFSNEGRDGGKPWKIKKKDWDRIKGYMSGTVLSRGKTLNTSFNNYYKDVFRTPIRVTLVRETKVREGGKVVDIQLEYLPTILRGCTMVYDGITGGGDWVAYPTPHLRFNDNEAGSAETLVVNKPVKKWIPEVKYPDIWNPPVGQPTINVPAVGEPEIWVPEVKYPDVWNPPVGEPTIKVPAQGDPQIWVPAVNHPDVWIKYADRTNVDLEPKPSISCAASLGRLFVTTGYKLWQITLDGGQNEYDEFLDPSYKPKW